MGVMLFLLLIEMVLKYMLIYFEFFVGGLGGLFWFVGVFVGLDC